MLPKLVFVLNSFITFTRSSIATRVNETGLIETVSVDQARMDYDPITLAQKGLLIEETRTNIIIRSNELGSAAWAKNRVTVTSSTDIPIFTNDNVWLITSESTGGFKFLSRSYATSSTIRTASVFLRRGTNIFEQIFVGNDSGIFANFNLETGQVSRSAGVIASTITSWRDGWYRCTLTLSSSTAN